PLRPPSPTLFPSTTLFRSSPTFLSPHGALPHEPQRRVSWNAQAHAASRRDLWPSAWRWLGFPRSALPRRADSHPRRRGAGGSFRSEEHTLNSSHVSISYAV